MLCWQVKFLFFPAFFEFPPRPPPHFISSVSLVYLTDPVRIFHLRLYSNVPGRLGESSEIIGESSQKLEYQREGKRA